MTDDDLAAETHDTRDRLATLLTDLGPDQRTAVSLVDGWRVSEVVAQLTKTGDGEPRVMPVKDVLLVVTGRRAIVDISGSER